MVKYADKRTDKIIQKIVKDNKIICERCDKRRIELYMGLCKKCCNKL